MASWKTLDIPSQTGRTAVVTGAGGLGFETALALARAGSEVIIASRNLQKGGEAVAKIQARAPAATVSFELVDLASLKSVADFATRLAARRPTLDLLVNNAGVMRPPERMETEDGFELQLGTNYLGHFALTAHLMPMLRRGRAPRVVTLSSIAAGRGAIDFDDLQAKHRYAPMPVYSQSKLACLMFAFELQRRSDAGGWGVASLAAHPGLSRTDLIRNAPGAQGRMPVAFRLARLMFQSAAQGALPTLFAATAQEAEPGAYFGPKNQSETRGPPALCKIPSQAADKGAAERLWRVSMELTGASFDPERDAAEARR